MLSKKKNPVLFFTALFVNDKAAVLTATHVSHLRLVQLRLPNFLDSYRCCFPLLGRGHNNFYKTEIRQLL